MGTHQPAQCQDCLGSVWCICLGLPSPLLSWAAAAKYQLGAAGHRLLPSLATAHPALPPAVTWLLDLAAPSDTFPRIWQPSHSTFTHGMFGPGPVSGCPSLAVAIL